MVPDRPAGDKVEGVEMLASRFGTVARVLSLAVVLVTSPGGTALGQDAGIAPVTDAILQDPPADDWLMWRRTLDGWGFRSRCFATS